MSEHSSRSPRKAMSVLVRPPPPWNFSTIQGWANKEFPTAVNAVTATIDGLIFQGLQEGYRVRNFKDPTSGLPPGTVNQILLVGQGNRSEFEGKKVFAYICSEKCGVGYLISHGDNDYTRLKIQTQLPCIDFEEPFSDIGGINSFSTLHKRIRALVLYFYLAKGFIREIERFTTFPEEIKKTCLWIANGGQKPDCLNRSVPRNPQGNFTSRGRDLERINHTTSNLHELDATTSGKPSSKNIDIQETVVEKSPDIKRERELDEGDDESDSTELTFPASKRQATEHHVRSPVQHQLNNPADVDPFFNLQEQVSDSYWKMSTERHVLVETTQLMTDANLKLTQEHDTLRQQFMQREEEFRSMREAFEAAFEEAMQWKTQAEAGQAAKKELADFKKEVADAFSKLMSGGSG